MFKDTDFITNSKVPGPTKEEIRCLVISKSQLKKEDEILEIGCGTGGLTLEFAKRCKKVYSVDKNPDAIDLTRENLIKHDLLEKVELFQEEALNVIKNIDKINMLVIGGSGGDLLEILEIGSQKLTSGGKIIVTAILLETKTEAISKLKELGFSVEIIEVNISKGRILERGTMMYAQNPISIIYTV